MVLIFLGRDLLYHRNLPAKNEQNLPSGSRDRPPLATAWQPMVGKRQLLWWRHAWRHWRVWRHHVTSSRLHSHFCQNWTRDLSMPVIVHLCQCTVGSYASLCICLSVCLAKCCFQGMVDSWVMGIHKDLFSPSSYQEGLGIHEDSWIGWGYCGWKSIPMTHESAMPCVIHWGPRS